MAEFSQQNKQEAEQKSSDSLNKLSVGGPKRRGPPSRKKASNRLTEDVREEEKGDDN